MTTTGTPSRMPRAQRRAQLIRVATDVFAQSGYHMASMDEVASAAGVSKPVLYQHFASKKDLYIAVVDTAACMLDEVLRPALDLPDHRQRTEVAVAELLRFVSEHPAEYLTLHFRDNYEDEVRDRVTQSRNLFAERIAHVFSDAVGLPSTWAGSLGAVVVGMVDSAGLYLQENPQLDLEEYTAFVTTVLWNGLSAIYAGGGTGTATDGVGAPTAVE